MVFLKWCYSTFVHGKQLFASLFKTLYLRRKWSSTNKGCAWLFSSTLRCVCVSDTDSVTFILKSCHSPLAFTFYAIQGRGRYKEGKIYYKNLFKSKVPLWMIFFSVNFLCWEWNAVHNKRMCKKAKSTTWKAYLDATL